MGYNSTDMFVKIIAMCIKRSWQNPKCALGFLKPQFISEIVQCLHVTDEEIRFIYLVAEREQGPRSPDSLPRWA